MHKVAKKSHYILACKDISLKHKCLVERLDNLANQISSEIEVFNRHKGQQRRVQIDFVRHAVHTCDESFSDRRPVRLLFKHESARQLRLEFLKVVVTIVSHLVSDPNDHQL